MSPMNNRRMTPMAEPGVLDFAPGAAAAYSLRNLSLSYSSPVVTVRRSTDSAEADFTAAEVSDGTLAGWAGADGFVKQWWDQSGNARHATASGAAQPQIVDSGVLVTEGGKAAVRFDGVNDYLSSVTLASVFSGVDKATSTFCVGSDDPANTGTFWNAGSSSDNRPLYRVDTAAGSVRMWARNDLNQSMTTISAEFSGQTLSSAFFLPSSQSFYVNGGFAGGDSTTLGQVTLNEFAIGILVRTTAYSFPLDGTISELIIYPTDQTALRTRIEGNIAWYYS